MEALGRKARLRVLSIGHAQVSVGAGPAAGPLVTDARAGAAEERSRLRLLRGERSLLWRVFAANVAVAVVAFAGLAWAPVTVRRVATPRELVILSVGLLVMLMVDLVLLRRAFGPLQSLTAVMSAVDPGRPGLRAEPARRAGREAVALARALNAMLDRLEDERRESSRRILAAQEGERSRIARELHDEVGQMLTAVALGAERAAAEPAPQTEALREIARTVLASIEDVHRIGRELRPEALDDLGLVSALVTLCSRVERQGAVPVRRDLSWRVPALSSEVELVIYRVAQEALTNALRHARATGITVALTGTKNGVVLVVRDDGRGMPERRYERGLNGMRERALLIGAELAIRSSPGAGTEVILSVPVGDAER
jgi:two-component system, NarL family, sensor histidine kinase UhpB